jgi:thioredoxin-dependent peroxiredoxin
MQQLQRIKHLLLTKHTMQITLTTGQKTTHITLSELLNKSKQTILYFYPKDNTPGCSLEARDFSVQLKTFLEKGIQIIGVSKDSEKSHCGFIEKQELTIPLISDPELILHKQF